MKQSQKLSPSKKLKNRREFLRFFEGAKAFKSPYFIIFRIENSVGHARLGITIKVRISSVTRMKLKRVVREAFRTVSSSLGAYDFNVVIPAGTKTSHPYPLNLAKSLERTLSSLCT